MKMKAPALFLLTAIIFLLAARGGGEIPFASGPSGAPSSSPPGAAEPPARGEEDAQSGGTTPADGEVPEQSEPAAGGEPEREDRIFGSDEVGYVTTPQNWVDFIDIDGASARQCSNAIGTQIISLDTVTRPEGAGDDFGAMRAAQAIWYSLDQRGEVAEVRGGTSTLAEKTAYRLLALYEDGDILVIWLLEGDDGVIYYVAAEGAPDRIAEAVGYVEEGYRLPETE